MAHKRAMSQISDFDIVVVGAGPAGLAFVRSLAGVGLSVALIEGQDEAALREPAFDGREIALTHHSMRLLKTMGAWDRIPADHISDLRQARVLDGGSPFALTFTDESFNCSREMWVRFMVMSFRLAKFRDMRSP